MRNIDVFLLLCLLLVHCVALSAHPFDLSEYRNTVLHDREVIVRNLTQSLMNQHLVMIGDSIMRQQYLSLTFLLRGKIFTDVDHHRENGWFEHFVYTNNELKPYEFCDCYRKNEYDYDSYCENRFYFDPAYNLSVTYLQYFGKDLFGHWFDDGDFDSYREPREQRLKTLWRLSIQDTISYMLSKFKQRVTLLMINFDHWEFSNHRKPFVWDNALSDAVYEASMMLLGKPSYTATEDFPLSNRMLINQTGTFEEQEFTFGESKSKNNKSKERAVHVNQHSTGRRFIWKTGTHARSDFEIDHNPTSIHARDTYMCSKHHVACFNLSWTHQLSDDQYVDHIHFNEVVSDIINLQFLYDFLR